MGRGVKILTTYRTSFVNGPSDSGRGIPAPQKRPAYIGGDSLGRSPSSFSLSDPPPALDSDTTLRTFSSRWKTLSLHAPITTLLLRSDFSRIEFLFSVEAEEEEAICSMQLGRTCAAQAATTLGACAVTSSRT